jgi:hypothetical protein
MPALLFYGCESDMNGCLKSKGPVVEKVRPVGSFTYVMINDEFDVHLCNDSLNHLSLRGGENVLPYIEQEIRNDTLYIRNAIRCKWAREYQKVELSIFSDTLDYVYLAQSCNLFTPDTFRTEKLVLFSVNDMSYIDIQIDCDAFFFKTSYHATGKFYFSGIAHYVHIWPYYASTVHAKNLEANTVKVLHHSIGDVYVNASKVVDCEFFNTGKVYYTGQPDKVNCTDFGKCIAY